MGTIFLAYQATKLSLLPDNLDLLGAGALGASLGAAVASGIALVLPTRGDVAKGGQFAAIGTILGYFVAVLTIALLVVVGRPHGVIK
jgi:hypothetical protein